MKPIIDGVLDEESQGAIRDEFADADLGDRRREERLRAVVRSAAVNPSASLPNIAGDDAALEGLYRLLSNEAVRPEKILAPHRARTMERARTAGVALAVHDTTENEFVGDVVRTGLGPLRSGNEQGFLAHVSLLAAADGSRLPFGVGAITTWARNKFRKKPGKRKKRSGGELAAVRNKESSRWLDHVEQLEEEAGGCRLIHIADREADSFALLADLKHKNRSFVIRLRCNRVAREGDHDGVEHIEDIKIRTVSKMTVDVEVSPRKAKSAPAMKKAHPARAARTATVEYSAARLRIRCPYYVKNAPKWLELNAVFVREIDAPNGEEPLSWTLLTTEPIDTAEQLAQVVAYYRGRWVIEEFFKALKTGCSYEKRQLESYDALVNLLAIFIPIATQMLKLRALSRMTPDAPATEVLTPVQIAVLRACVRKPLSATPSTREVLLAIAGLGGHVNRREPGWLVIARGFEKLSFVLAGWLAREALEDVRNP